MASYVEFSDTVSRGEILPAYRQLLIEINYCLNLFKGSSGESTINYTSRFNVIAYIDSKHYIKSLTRPN